MLKTYRLKIAASLLLTGLALAQTPAIPTGPWKELFNKKDLTGWSSVGNPPWSITNGILQSKGQNIDNCRRTLKVGEWTTTVARIDGAKISLWLNGTHCLDYTFTNTEHLNGSIFALQSHPPFDAIEYEYVRMRKLNISGCTNP